MTADEVEAYASKPLDYFSGARVDFIDEMPLDSDAAILEIGCGTGDTGAYALQRGKCGHYAGVELSEAAAARARAALSEVVVGNVATVPLPWPNERFDALVMSEVIEHLVDPWAVLRRVRPFLKPGARVYASSPNISHYRVIIDLLRGRWVHTESGVMDRTHLRWFTPTAYSDLFATSGFVVDSTGPVAAFRPKARIVMALSAGTTKHLFMTQTSLRAHTPTADEGSPGETRRSRLPSTAE